MKKFLVFRTPEYYTHNRLFIVKAENGEAAMQKVCDMLNDKYARYADFNGTVEDCNGSKSLYSPELDGFSFLEIRDDDKDVIQIS